MNKKSFIEIIEHIDNFVRHSIVQCETAERAMVKIHLIGGRSLGMALVDIEPHENFVVLTSVTGEEQEFIPYENIMSLAI